MVISSFQPAAATVQPLQGAWPSSSSSTLEWVGKMQLPGKHFPWAMSYFCSEGTLVFKEMLATGFIETIVHASVHQEERRGINSHLYLSLVQSPTVLHTVGWILRHQTAKNMRRIFH